VVANTATDRDALPTSGAQGVSDDRLHTDLRRHAEDFTRGAGFTFTVLDPGDHDVIGCDVAIGGGADVIRQALAAGKVDELVISTAPVILGAGKRLFDGFDQDMDLEVTKVYSSPYATHIRYTVTK
jgi:dihydrofolate reductase